MVERSVIFFMHVATGLDRLEPIYGDAGSGPGVREAVCLVCFRRLELRTPSFVQAMMTLGCWLCTR